MATLLFELDFVIVIRKYRSLIKMTKSNINRLLVGLFAATFDAEQINKFNMGYRTHRTLSNRK